MTTAITFLGTGGALPPPHHAQSGILIEKNKQKLLIDCGSGILLRLGDAGVDLADVDTVLISHLHLDHVSELLPIITARWLAGHTSTEIIGPVGIENYIHNLIAPHDYVKSHVQVIVREVLPTVPFEAAGFSTTALETEHWVYTLAFKFDDQFVYSADTNPIEPMADFAEGCELLIHECSFPDGFDAPYHTTPTALGKLLEHSSIPKLVLTHFYPEILDSKERAAEAIKRHYTGEVIFAQDLARLEL